MKRIIYVWLAGMILAGTLAAMAGAQSQSLGDYARTVRKDKDKEQKPAAVKSYDNDNLPKDDKLSVVGPAPQESANKAAQTAQNGTPAAADAGAAKNTETESPEDRQKRFEDWKSKISDQKSAVDLLSRELNVEQGEYKLRAAAFYGDAGDRLRNAAAWDKEDAQYKQKIADKQKALDSAKQKLGDLQEDARRAGVPASMRQ